MFRITKGQKLPAPRWIAVHKIGTGDGRSREFPLPAGEEVTTGFVRSYRVGKTYVRGEQTIRYNGALLDGNLVFDEGSEPDPGAPIFAVRFDARDGADVALAVLPMTVGVNDAMQVAIEKAKNARRVKELDPIALYELSFTLLVKDWEGVTDEANDQPIACDEEAKLAFVRSCDAGLFGSIVMEASQDLQMTLRREKETERGN